MKHTKILPLVTLLLIIFLDAACLKAQPTTDVFKMEKYQDWSDETDYERVYVVDKHHPDASDTNPGTPEKPLRTINKAAQLAKPGEKVLVHGGVYREMIEPKRGGTSPKKMINYEAAHNEKVVVKGSRVLHNKWEQRSIYSHDLEDTSLTYTWSRKLWVTKIPDSLFLEAYFPFKLKNIMADEYKLMPWAKPIRGHAPFSLTRGMLFQNGKRLKQAEAYGDLTRIPGSFWVDNDHKTIHIHPFGSDNPNNDLFEVAVQSHLFKPQKIDLGYIKLKGFTFAHCANGFLRTSTGAVTARGGHHWIIENLTIRHINSSGLEFGHKAFETHDPHPDNVRKDRPVKGGMIVRNNEIYQCGTAGIRSHTVKNGIIAHNEIRHCGWQDAEYYWECSGIKMLRNTHTLVRGNHIHHIQGGSGIWLDWDNKHSRVTRNIIHDIQTLQGGIFVEASTSPSLVDNNIIWDIDGNGLYGNDSDHQLWLHNLVARTTQAAVHIVVATDRSLDGEALTAEQNTIKNNMFIDAGRNMNLSAGNNKVDYNLYITTCQPDAIDLQEQREKGYDKNSRKIYGYVSFNPKVGFLRWEVPEKIQEVPAAEAVARDFFNNRRRSSSTLPGPFAEIPENGDILLRR